MEFKFDGLSDEQVAKSREQYGSNAIPDSEPTTFLKEFLETFSDPMIKILLAISILMFGMFFLGYAEIYEPLGTVIAILIVAFVTAKTGVASDTKYRELKDSAEKEKCKVLRNKKVFEIDFDDVVAGDYIVLQSGDKVPADGTLLQGNLKVDNSALNGEAEECKKQPGDITLFPEEITGETFVDKSSLFRGSIVSDGEGLMQVLRVGLQTMMGKMAEEMQEDEPDSPLKVKLAKLANQISTFGYCGAAVITILYMIYFIMNAGGPAEYFHQPIPDIIKNIVDAVSLAVIIIVCAVPEGLPLMISLVLMQNTSKMLDHNVMVRKAQGIETAGSLNILFSDKTGTITKGQLEVVEFFLGNGSVRNYKDVSKVAEELKISIAKNTNALFDDKDKAIGGNMTDRALLNFLGKNDFTETSTNQDLVVKASQGFNSTNKFSQAQIGDKTYYKGAPERLVEVANYYLNESGYSTLIDKDKLNAKIDELANRAIRVLAFGFSEKDMEENKVNDDITIIGLVGIRDDVRPEAVDAIKEVREAGIQVVMITGDRLETAKSIATDAGLFDPNSDDIALTSKELNSMDDNAVKAIIPRIRVIARALPTDKSRMVKLSQELNLVCGMTGDGVNDSPALKRADVGFAMGISGTEAAKEAAEIVLLDDNFKSIRNAILYGRTIYHNILKFCMFQLTINVTAVVVSAIAPFFGIEEPLKVTHLLFVNLVMDGLGAIMLGNEPAFEKYMKEKPRRRDESIISKAMACQIGIMAAWLILLSFTYLKAPVFINRFANEDQHITGYFVLFIAAALFNGFNVRDEGFGIFKGLDENKGFLKVFFSILIIQALIVCSGLIPGLNIIAKMFSCTPFVFVNWIMIYVLAATMIPVDLIRKLFTKN